VVKDIHSLIPDIYKAISNKPEGWFDDQLMAGMMGPLGIKLKEHFNDPRNTGRLRMSALGPRCPRALWYSVHRPELAEKLPPWAEIKFAYGHILESLVIALAKAAGHEVTGEQDVLELDGVVGHRDCVIDGCTVDVKSASSFSFQKIKNGNLPLVDNFGYLDQLDAYCVAGAGDPLVRIKDLGYILAIEKQLGHLCIHEHHVRPDHIRDRVRDCKAIISNQEPPKCECGTEAIGASGNRKLDVKASYSAYKWECFPHLRAFRYAGGVMYLSKVVKKPDVLEVNKYGKVVY
jgi:hypothetical protein